MHFRPLRFLLILGVIFGFGSGFASVARHHGQCHRWGDRYDRGDYSQVTPLAPAAPVVQVPAPAPVQQQQAPATQSAPVIVQAPATQPAPVIVVLPPYNQAPTVITAPNNNNAPAPVRGDAPAAQ